MKRTDGFTLIELLVTLVMVAIIMAVGIPGLSSLMANNQATAHSNDLITAISFARSESVKRGTRVSICAKSAAEEDNYTCGGKDDTWSNGWFAFLDPNGNAATGYTPPASNLQRSWSAPSGNYATKGPVSISFNSSGSIQANKDKTFTIKYSHCSGHQNRKIILKTTGRTSISKEECT